MNPLFCFMSNLLFSFVVPLGRNEKYRDRCSHSVSKIPVCKKNKTKKRAGYDQTSWGPCSGIMCWNAHILPKTGSLSESSPKRCIAWSQKAAGSYFQKPTLLLLHMKYGAKMNNTQHLLIWHAKYTCLVQRWYRGFCGSTPVPPLTPPRCDKAVTPHLRGPHWIILPECIIDTFNLSRHSAVWPLAAEGGGAWQAIFDLSVFNYSLQRWMCFKKRRRWKGLLLIHSRAGRNSTL